MKFPAPSSLAAGLILLAARMWPRASRACRVGGAVRLFSFALVLLTSLSPAWAGTPQVVPVGQTCDPNTAASFQEQSAECTGTAFQRPAFQFGAAVAACAAGTAGMVQWTASTLQYCDGSNWQTIATGSGLPALAGANIWVGNGSNVATAVQVSQDVTITNAGVATVGKIQNVSVGSPTGTAGSAVVLATSPTISAPTLTGTTAGANLTLSGTEAMTLGSDYTTTGSQNDVSLGTVSAVRYNGAGTATFTGIVAGSNVAGQVLILHNASASALTVSNQSASSTAANRIITGTGSDLAMTTNTSATLQYDGTASRWRVTSFSGTATAATTLNSITAATGNQAGIANGANTIVWNWDTLAGGSALKLVSTSTAAASNAQKMFEIALSGTNGTSAQTTYGAYISNTHAGTTSSNVGLYATASGGTNINFAIEGVTSGTNNYSDFGVYGHSTGASGVVSGVYGDSASPNGYGVFGQTQASAGVGVFGQADTGSATGVEGYSGSTTNGTAGVGGKRQERPALPTAWRVMTPARRQAQAFTAMKRAACMATRRAPAAMAGISPTPTAAMPSSPAAAMSASTNPRRGSF